MEKVYWNNENLPSLVTLDNVMNSIRNHDIREGLLYEAVTIEDIIADSDGVIVTDGIVTPLSRLQAKIFAMQRVMNSVAKEGLKVVGDAQISDPFMRLGTANIAVIFQLEDGQTISVFFHNPDVNPKTITGSDTLISFKWLLNKKDVSIVVAPERGQEINVRQVAMRIMRLAEKNSVAFQRQNAQSAARKEKLAALKSEIEEKRTALSVKLKEIEELEAFNARSETDKAIDEEEYQKNVAHYETIAQELEEHYGVNDNFWESSIAEIQSIPTALAERLEIGLEEANFHYERYIFKAKRLGLTKVADILESQQRTGQLLTAFVSRIFDGEDMFNKALQESYNQDAINSLGKPAQKFVTDLRAVFGYTEPQQEQIIELSGNEFVNGDKDFTIKENKTALRDEVRGYLENLIGKTEKGKEPKGKIVHNIALDRDVLLSTRGMNEMLNWSADPRKLKAIAAIEDIIRTAKPEAGTNPRQDNEKRENKPFALAYYHLKAKVSIAGEELPPVRVIFEEDDKGLLHYDFIIQKEKVALDSIGTSPHDTKPWNEPIGNATYVDKSTTILDGTQGEFVLNLFFLDKDGNVIPDEDEVLPEDEAKSQQSDFLGATGVQSKAEDNSIKLTGNELGDFDISTDEGKKALREAAFNHLVKLADNGDTVFCKAVNAEVGFNKAGVKKFKSLGANPIKNQLAAAIKQVIQNAELVRKDIPSYDTDEQKRNITYSVVKTKVTVSGEDYGVRTVLRKLEDGQYQYDVQVKDNFEMIMDSANENGLWAARLTKSDVPQSVSNQDLSLDSDNTTPLFDSVQAENIKLAIAYVNSLDHQVVLDDTSLAKETLESTLAMLQNNLPINVKEGNFEQAKLESEHIQSIKEALITLDSADDDGYVLNLFVYDKDGNLLADEYITDNGDKDIGRSGNKHILIRDAMSVLKKDVFSNKIANTVLALNVDSGYFEVIKNTRKAVDDFVRSNSNVELFQYPDVNRLSKHIRYIKGEENKEAADILERIGYTVDRRDPDDFTKGFYIGQEFLLKGATGKFMEASFKLIEFRGLNMGAEEPFAVLQMGNTIHSEPVSKLTEKITNRDVLIFSGDDKQEEAQEIQAKFKQQFESLKDEIKLFLEQNKYEYNPIDWTYIKSTHNGEIVAYLTDTNINVDLKVKDTPLNKNVVESHIFRFNEISATKIIDELKRMESRDLSEALATYQEEQNMQQQKIWAAFGLNTKSKETPMTENQEGKEDLSVHSNDELQYEQKLDAKANRKYAITAEMKDQFIQLCRQYGYDDGYLSDVSIGNTVFYIEKEMNDAKVSIEAAFKGSQVERHQDNYYDFTVSGDKANDIQSEWFYTNDFAEALKWGNEWLAKLDSDDKDKSIMKETESSADFQFLQDIIDGKVDVVADSFEDEFEPIVERLGEEHELVKQALEVYAQTIEKFTAGE